MDVLCAADTKTTPVHRVIGGSAIVDEMIVEFTHDQEVCTTSHLLLPLSVVHLCMRACMQLLRLMVLN